jgi:hypothetical protein
LRKAGDGMPEATRRITLSDLLRNEVVLPKATESAFATIKVHRPGGKGDYSVPVESYDGATTVGRRTPRN